MRARLLGFGALVTLALTGAAHTKLMLLLGTSSGGSGHVVAPVNVTPPEIKGLDTVGSTLAFNTGTWTGAGITLTHSWHYVNPTTSIGTGTTYGALVTGEIGKPIELDETATNSGGAVTVSSHWVGPVEASLPVAPVAFETCLNGSTWTPGTLLTCGGVSNIDPTVLPGPPTNFLQNGHAIYPGCDVPPVAQNTTAGHVWYFDPINGKTQAAGGTGADLAHAFKDVSAIFGTVTNYSSSPLFGHGRTIPPGDTIYVEPGNVSNPVGSIITATAQYSTSDGTATGTVAGNWTWIMGDPAAASRPVLNQISNGAAKGFIFKHFGVEPAVQNTPFLQAVVAGGATEAAPAHDLLYEDIKVSSWIGHSDDPWNPSSYPMTGGSSDGTVVTASPTFLGAEDPIRVTVTMAQHDTSITGLTTFPSFFGWYVWSPGYFNGGGSVIQSPSTGIPNGTIVQSINGLTAAQWSDKGAVNALLPADLTAATPNNGTVTTTGAMTGTTGYWILATSSTVTQSVFVWNGTAWASVGIIPPQTATSPAQWVISHVGFPNHNHVLNWTGSAWVDLGAASVGLGPCDPVNDAATGCPSGDYGSITHGAGSNVPWCDPQITISGATSGGCGGSPVAWAGATTGFTGTLSFTNRLVITPAGAFNNSDWGAAIQYGFLFTGAISASPLDPSNPNLYIGTHCISVKDSWVRNVSNDIGFSKASNSIAYNNRFKYRTMDGADLYSVNRVWYIHNSDYEPVQTWNHPDGVQIAVAGQTSNIKYLFGNALVENEVLQNTDPTNYMPTFTEGIGNTDTDQWGDYAADNVVRDTLSAMAVAGRYNVIVNNTAIGSAITGGKQKKDTTYGGPLGSMLANNVANGVNRLTAGEASVATPCDPVAGDLQIVETNLVIPFLPISATQNSSIYCDNTNTLQFNEGIGVFNPAGYTGQSVWTHIAWDSQDTGISPLFQDYAPLASATVGQPGYNIQPMGTLPCINLSVTPFGCLMGGFGAINTRPNNSFSGAPGPILGTFAFLDGGHIPTSPVVNGYYVVQRTSQFTEGVAQYCPGCSGASTTGAVGYVQISTDFNPGIIGAGTALGAQMPIADANGKAWATTPSIGAYELH